MRLRERLTYANVVATLCLVLLVVGGGSVAHAHGLIGSSDIKKNAVKSKHIKPSAVKSSDLKNNAVSSAKIRNGAVGSAEIADGSVDSADISPEADGMVQAAAHVKGNGTVTRSFNRLGGAITVEKTATGQYWLTVPGGATTDDGMIGLAVSRNYLTDCRQWDVSGGKIQVVCYNQATSAYADTLFDFALIKY